MCEMSLWTSESVYLQPFDHRRAMAGGMRIHAIGLTWMASSVCVKSQRPKMGQVALSAGRHGQ